MYNPQKIPTFKRRKDIELDWNTFNGGLNTLFKPTELRPNELAQADNLMLIGKGTPTGRWGSQVYHLAGESRVRLLDAYYNSNASTNVLLSITDDGYLTKKSGASYTIITGSSFASGFTYQSAQLGGNTYVASASLNFVKFDGTNLIPYVGVSTPTNVSVAQLSAASGFNSYSWRVSAISNTGETLASVSKSLASLPLDLTETAIKLSWNTVSAASGVLQGYNVYRGFPGYETWLVGLDSTAIQYTDTGLPAAQVTFAPNQDTTAGPKAKYILKFDDRIILAGIQGDPSAVYISARYPYQDRFTAISGGIVTYVAPDDGDFITGLGVANQQSQQPVILVFKNNSVHAISLSTVTLGQFVILDPTVHVLTASTGCSSGDTVVAVENDMFYFGRKGLYSIGSEPNFLNQIRTNEISARIRPYIQNLTDADFREANAAYIDYKYILSFPTRKETIIYDRQRGSFMGPWTTSSPNFGITKWFKYFDSSGAEVWLAGCTDGYVRSFTEALVSDSGTAIGKTLRTGKSDLGKWNTFKILKLISFLFRNLKGTVTFNLRIEDRNGATVTTKTATLTSSLGGSGWGIDPWGLQKYGISAGTVVLTGDEIVRFSRIFKQMRVLQIEVISTTSNSNWEFLGFRASAQDLGEESLPSADKV